MTKYEGDIVYIDPPYNSRQYSDAYHFLENLAQHQKPEVKGVARKMDRSKLKSSYCTNRAVATFRDLIGKIKAKYIIVFYNNTGTKINSRSNAKISDQEILEILQTRGQVFTYEKAINAFTTGKTNVEDHKERLFVCEVYPEVNSKTQNFQIKNSKSKQFKGSKLFKDRKPTLGLGLVELDLEQEINSETIIKSPLNYTGGKSKLLPQLKEKFPQELEVFYDVFSGGANVGINIEAKKFIVLITILD
ncbi:hypothetical protein CKF59_02180 [Psittacicella gerlachiana]|uniref:site-specific DNA-methyltransferase (adenine-specific) n=1 Tax=Psittacicella gerlachiana TaxID=2028574 RepID=A0A3A1YGW1_9GAMM|nr:hypothetical protein CKF59_02180 [Psittacicella gerlachiana]